MTPKIIKIEKTDDCWSHFIDLLDIAAAELRKDGHETLAVKIELCSAEITQNCGFMREKQKNDSTN